MRHLHDCWRVLVSVNKEKSPQWYLPADSVFASILCTVLHTLLALSSKQDQMGPMLGCHSGLLFVGVYVLARWQPCVSVNIEGIFLVVLDSRLKLSHSGQDKHAWNEVQRNDRPADTGSLETRL
jgi:hypothetical protein